MVFRAEKSRWESCDKFVYTSVGTEHSHWSVFDSCQNISIIAYLFYVSFVLEIAVGWTDVAFEGERILWWSRIQSIGRLVHKLEAAPFHHSPNADHPRPASAKRSQRANSKIPPVRDRSSSAPWIPLVQNFQYGWDTNAVQDAIQPYSGIQWQLNSSREILWHREEKKETSF